MVLALVLVVAGAMWPVAADVDGWIIVSGCTPAVDPLRKSCRDSRSLGVRVKSMREG
jgi:hypothetical protein